MNATKRKLNALIQGIGAKSSEIHERPATAGSVTHDASSLTLASTSPAEDASNLTMALSRPTHGSSAVPMSSITSEFLSKRRRVGVLGTTTGNAHGAGSSLSKTTVSNITLKKLVPSTDAAQAKETNAELPRYCPSDREQLIARLSSFQELTEWTPKPDPVNEIEWAKRGWVCQGKERVRCTLCNKELVVRTNKREVQGQEVSVVAGSDIEQALVKKFAEQIVEAHQDDCLWRKRGCEGKNAPSC
jgi:hypothetical protein